MPKQQLITVSENVKALVNSLSNHLLDAQRSIFEACKILGNLHVFITKRNFSTIH